jgi:hypothetical protein
MLQLPMTTKVGFKLDLLEKISVLQLKSQQQLVPMFPSDKKLMITSRFSRKTATVEKISDLCINLLWKI